MGGPRWAAENCKISMPKVWQKVSAKNPFFRENALLQNRAKPVPDRARNL